MFKRSVVCVITLLLLVRVGLAEPLPRIEIEQPVFDFGAVLRGQLVEHTFVFRNVGDAELMIDRVKSTCGCTGVLLSEKNIAPGNKGTIKATFNSSRFKGAVRKNILLYSNDPSGQPVTFTVKGIVTIPLVANPARLLLGDVSSGQTKTISAVLTNKSGQPVTFTNIRTSNTAFRAEVDVNSLENNASTELRVIATPDIDTTNLAGAVLIRLDLPGLGEISIPVSGSVVKPSPDKK